MGKNDSSSAPKIIYVGIDNSYFNDVRSRFKASYPQNDYNFVVLENSDNYHQTFLQILAIKPLIIYIDFSGKGKVRTYLTRLLKREFSTRNIPLVALVEKEEQLKECNATGVDFTHIKCGEISDVVYDPCFLVYTKSVKKPDYARAKFIKDAELFEDFRVGYFTATYMRVESNMRYTKGDIVEVTTSIPEKTMPSKNFIVRNVYESDLFFDYKYAYDLDYVFVDKPETIDVEGGDAKAVAIANKERLEEYQNALVVVKKKVVAWIKDNTSTSAPKATKVLIVDKTMRFFANMEKSIEEYPYGIRCQTELTDLDYLEKIRPNIIAFEFFEIIDSENKSADGKEVKKDSKAPLSAKEKEAAPKNAVEQLTLIVKKIKSMPNYSPFIVVFNCLKFTSKSFQDSFQYPMILVDKLTLSMNKVIDFADMFDKKIEKKLEDAIKEKVLQLKKQDPNKYRKLTASDFKEAKFYPKSSSPLSYASCKYFIQLTSMTESELSFLADPEFVGDQFSLKFPASIHIRIVLGDTGKKCVIEQKKNSYKALIHAAGEAQKKMLRKFVNEIFFTDLNNRKAKEKEEFDKKNKEALDKIAADAEANSDIRTPPAQTAPTPITVETKDNKAKAG